MNTFLKRAHTSQGCMYNAFDGSLTPSVLQSGTTLIGQFCQGLLLFHEVQSGNRGRPQSGISTI